MFIYIIFISEFSVCLNKIFESCMHVMNIERFPRRECLSARSEKPWKCIILFRRSRRLVPIAISGVFKDGLRFVMGSCHPQTRRHFLSEIRPFRQLVCQITRTRIEKKSDRVALFKKFFVVSGPALTKTNWTNKFLDLRRRCSTQKNI